MAKVLQVYAEPTKWVDLGPGPLLVQLLDPTAVYLAISDTQPNAKDIGATGFEILTKVGSWRNARNVIDFNVIHHVWAKSALSVKQLVMVEYATPQTAAGGIQSVEAPQQTSVSSGGSSAEGSGSGGVTRSYNFALSVMSWSIAHGLGRFPSVTLVDTAGDQVMADVQYQDSNNILVTFGAPTAGTAYLN